MTLLVFLMIIVLFTCSSALLLKTRFEEAVPTVICSIIIILYISGLAGSLIPGFVLLIMSVPFLCIMAVWRTKESWKIALMNYIFTPGFVVFCICMLCMLPWILQKRTNTWDEFDHWSLAIKNMFYFNRLTDGRRDSELFVGYPPAMALFAYFAQKMGRTYAECKSYMAYDLMYVGLLIPAFSMIRKWKGELIRILLLSFSIIMLPVVFLEDTYDITYVDIMLGMLMAYIIYTYFIWQGNIKVKVFNLSAASCVLCLTKEYGIAFAAVTIGIIILCEGGKKWMDRPYSLRTGIWTVAGMLAATLFGRYSWSIRLNIISAKRGQNLLRVVTDVQQNDTIIGKYISAILTEKLGVGIWMLPLWLWGIIFFLLFTGVVILCKDVKEKLFYGIGLAGMLGGLLVYIVVLMLSYQTFWSSGEGMELPSFERYLSSYLSAVLGVGVILLFYKSKKKPYYLAAAAVLALTAYLPLWKEIATAEPRRAWMYAEMPIDARFQNIARDFDMTGEDLKKVYFIHQDDPGYWYYAGNYGFTPSQCQRRGQPWSLGYGEANDYSMDEWAAVLVEDEFDYVFLNHVDQVFIKNYGALFETPEKIEDGRIFTIEKENGGVLLRRIEEYNY